MTVSFSFSLSLSLALSHYLALSISLSRSLSVRQPGAQSAALDRPRHPNAHLLGVSTTYMKVGGVYSDWSEFPIDPAYLHICSAMVGVPHLLRHPDPHLRRVQRTTHRKLEI